MTPLRQHMIAALQLSGKGERTQEASVREVRLLAQCSHTSPDRLSAQELQHSFLHRKNVDGLAPASMRICSSGIRFFSQHVLKRDWHTLTLIRAQTAHRLPAVLSVEEVRRLLTSATPVHHQVSFTTVYSLGLRLQEALALSRHWARSKTQRFGDLSHASHQCPGRLPQSQTPCRDHQNRRGHPYPQACVRHPSARSRRASPSHPALPG